MSDKWDQFCDEVHRLQRLQVKCACHHISAGDCYRSRYPRRIDGFDADDDPGDWDDAECECSCHDRISEAAADIWPERLDDAL